MKIPEPIIEPMTIVVQSYRRRPLTSSEEGTGRVAFREIADTPRETRKILEPKKKSTTERTETTEKSTSSHPVGIKDQPSCS
jgi:hypothetical protein